MSAAVLETPRFVHAELRPFAEDATLIITPEGEMFQVDGAPSELRRVLALCDGTRPLEEAAAASADPERFAEILGVLAETRCFARGPDAPADLSWLRFPAEGLRPERVTATRLVLLGDAPLVDQARELLDGRPFAAVETVSLGGLAALLERPERDGLLVLALRRVFDPEFLRGLNDLCDRAGVPWAQFHLDAGRGWLGPLVVPGQTADYRDLLVRRWTMLENRDDYATICALPLTPEQGAPLTPALPPARELRWMQAALLVELERWAAGAPCRLLGAELEADPQALELRVRPFLPLPDHALAGPLLAGTSPDGRQLISDRAGVIVRVEPVEHHPSAPPALHTVRAHVARMQWHYEDWPVGPVCSGSVFGDPEAALWAAIGETVERYCGNYMRDARPIKASYNELAARGEHAVDPDQLVLHTPSMYNAPGCRIAPFTRDLPVLWVRGRSLTRGCAAWLPFNLVYIYVYADPARLPHQPVTNSTFYPGVAAGASLEQALVSAIEEVVERDAATVWWMNAPRLPALHLPPDLAALWHGRPAEHGQRAWAIPLPNEFGIPVVAGVLENTRDRLLTVGLACRPDVRAATRKAWTEAIGLQEIARDLDRPDGSFYQMVETGMSYDVFKPWRQDRAYLDDYRADFRDLVHLLNQSQFFLDPRAIERVRPWVDVPPGVDLAQLPRLPERSLATYRARIEAHGYEIFYTDLTTPDIAHTGLSAVRVLIPGLAPNFPAAFPPAGGGRVQRAAVVLGWRDTPPAEDELNYLPMPYA